MQLPSLHDTCLCLIAVHIGVHKDEVLSPTAPYYKAESVSALSSAFAAHSLHPGPRQVVPPALLLLPCVLLCALRHDPVARPVHDIVPSQARLVCRPQGKRGSLKLHRLQKSYAFMQLWLDHAGGCRALSLHTEAILGGSMCSGAYVLGMLLCIWYAHVQFLCSM